MERMEKENGELKQHLTQLRQQVKSLDDRVTALEARSLASSMTDEGVDMNEERRCPFFDDCLCSSDSEDKTLATDGFVLDDERKKTMWQEDWEDCQGSDLADDLRKNSCKLSCH